MYLNGIALNETNKVKINRNECDKNASKIHTRTHEYIPDRFQLVLIPCVDPIL